MKSDFVRNNFIQETIMKTGAFILSMLLVAAMLIAATAACTTDTKKGGLVPNSYASQVQKINDTTLRITTRKTVSGDLEEVNKPGTTMYKALLTVQNGASARAAMEAKNLGYDVIQVLGSRNLTEVREKRNATADIFGENTTDSANSFSQSHGVGESGYTFAQGHYNNDVELAIELTVKLIPGKMPENPPKDYMDVNAVLTQIGLTDLVAGKK
jgi:hypothetical protein